MLENVHTEFYIPGKSIFNKNKLKNVIGDEQTPLTFLN